MLSVKLFWCLLVEFVQHCIIDIAAMAHVIDPMFDLCPDKFTERERGTLQPVFDLFLLNLCLNAVPLVFRVHLFP